MKIELKKETNPAKGETIFFVEIDGAIRVWTITNDYNIACKYYEALKTGQDKIVEILKSEEI